MSSSRSLSTSARVGAPLALALVALIPPIVGAAGPACLRPPVLAPVTDPFRAPACPWCPGNRGIEYEVAPGTTVRAAAAGTVTFTGAVAGVVFVVVEHADGLRATYGRLGSTHLRSGTGVPAGAVVGAAGRDGLYFGLRRGTTYVDPALYLGRLVERPRLVPTDGTAPRPAPSPDVSCPATSAGR